MGVMGWTPQIVIYDSSIENLACAFEGYKLFNCSDKDYKEFPSKDFMRAMVKKFPDNKE